MEGIRTERRIFFLPFELDCCWIGRDIYIYIYWWWTGVAIFYISLHRRNGNCFRELFLNVDRFLNIRRLKESDHYQVTFYIANKLLIHQLIRNDILDAPKFNLIIQIYRSCRYELKKIIEERKRGEKEEGREIRKREARTRLKTSRTRGALARI